MGDAFERSSCSAIIRRPRTTLDMGSKVRSSTLYPKAELTPQRAFMLTVNGQRVRGAKVRTNTCRFIRVPMRRTVRAAAGPEFDAEHAETRRSQRYRFPLRSPGLCVLCAEKAVPTNTEPAIVNRIQSGHLAVSFGAGCPHFCPSYVSARYLFV